MERVTQMQIEEQQLKSAPYYHASLNLTKLPPTDISILQTYVEDVYPLYSPKSQDTPLEFFISPTSSHYVDLNSTMLYMKLKVQTSSNATLAAASTTVPANFPFASIFSNLDVMVNNVSITSSSNNYPYATYINRVLGNSGEAKESKYRAELLLKEDSSTAVQATGEAYKVLKAARNEFEVIGKIGHGLFNQIRMLPPSASIRIKLRRSPNTFHLIGTDPATGSSFTDILTIDEAILKVKKVVIHRRVQEIHENSLMTGGRLEYPYKDFDVVSYSIPSGAQHHVSETIQMGEAPDAVVVGLVDSKAYSGLPSKSPYFFQPFNLSSLSVLLDGEPQLFKEIKLNVDKKQYMHAYSQLFNLLSPSDGGNGITPIDFKEKGMCLLVFDLNNAVRDNRFVLNKNGSLKISCTFSSGLAQNVNVICYLVHSKLLQIDGQNSVYLQ